MGTRPITLLNSVFGSSRSLLNQDLDAFLSEPVHARLCEGTGLAPEAVAAMTLADHLGTLHASAHPRGRKTWILPTTILLPTTASATASSSARHACATTHAPT